MSLHRTKATFIGLLEAGRVNEWILTEKLGDALKVKAAKKPRVSIRERLHLLELGVGMLLFLVACYGLAYGKNHYFLYLYLQSLAFFMGVPCVIYWKNTFSRYAACHFRQALLSVVQSSCSHTWDAFQLAHASFRLYCVRNNHVLPTNSHKVSSKVGPRLLGEPPKINIAPPEKEAEEEDEEGSSGSLLAIKVYGDDVNIRFLVCGVPCTLDAFLLGSLEDGLNAILSIENSSLRSKFFTDTESFVILCPLLHSSSKLPNEFSRPQGPKREIKEINPERRVTCPES
ncbi:PREDICTED: AT-rich interactive domain-containing protein 4-like isoform X4 [Nelumbo nucifera]|nr:PREDICTED: AT-rich interactive domain-containing protein 4-like isoform X4 [Nelumbo nucifera]